MKKLILFWEKHGESTRAFLVNTTILVTTLLVVLTHTLSDQSEVDPTVEEMVVHGATPCINYLDGIQICNTPQQEN